MKAVSGEQGAGSREQKAAESRQGSVEYGARAWAWLVLCSALFVGCGGKKETEAKDSGIYRIFERGPHTVVLRLDRQHPTVAQQVNLELEVQAAEDWKVIWPVVKKTLDQFQVVDQGERQPELMPDKRTRQVRSYVLEPGLSGAYRIPALEFQFQKPEAETQRLETEEIALEVKSVLPEEKQAKVVSGGSPGSSMNDIAPPVAYREKVKLGWFWGLLALLVLAGAAVWWWGRRRREAEAAPEPPRPAHEIALEELAALEALDLPGQGQAKRFYQELSAILRRYVENRYGVHAPGQTTDEFLVFQSRSGLLELGHQALLKDFLLHCDLVKFAEMDAGPEQAAKAMEACRTFVLETRLEEIPAVETA